MELYLSMTGDTISNVGDGRARPTTQFGKNKKEDKVHKWKKRPLKSAFDPGQIQEIGCYISWHVLIGFMPAAFKQGNYLFSRFVTSNESVNIQPIFFSIELHVHVIFEKVFQFAKKKKTILYNYFSY